MFMPMRFVLWPVLPALATPPNLF